MLSGQWLRSAPKPACISAQTLRARARAFGSAGHRPACGNFSARYSAIASVSQTTKPSSSISTGTLPAGVCRASACWNFESAARLSKRIITSSKGMPAWRISTQGRSDHDE